MRPYLIWLPNLLVVPLLAYQFTVIGLSYVFMVMAILSQALGNRRLSYQNNFD